MKNKVFQWFHKWCCLGIVLVAIFVVYQKALVVSAIDVSAIDIVSQEVAQLVEETEQYRIQYKLTNIRSVHTDAVVTIVANKKNGNARMILDFYNRSSTPQHVSLEWLVYNDFKDVYVKPFYWVKGLGVFEQMNDMSLKCCDETHYMKLAPHQLKSTLHQRQWIDYLIMMPKWKELETSQEMQRYVLDDWYHVSVQRPNIPERLFSHTELLNFRSQMQLNEDNRGNIEVVPHLLIGNDKNSVVFQVDMIGYETGTQVRETTFDSATLLDKLVQVDATYQPRTRVYRLTLEGIIEKMHLNIFQPQTAHLKTYDYRLEYELRPSNEVLPNQEDIQVINAS